MVSDAFTNEDCTYSMFVFSFQPIQREAEVVAEDDQVFLMKIQNLLSKQPTVTGRQVRNIYYTTNNCLDKIMFILHVCFYKYRFSFI